VDGETCRRQRPLDVLGGVALVLDQHDGVDHDDTSTPPDARGRCSNSRSLVTLGSGRGSGGAPDAMTRHIITPLFGDRPRALLSGPNGAVTDRCVTPSRFEFQGECVGEYRHESEFQKARDVPRERSLHDAEVGAPSVPDRSEQRRQRRERAFTAGARARALDALGGHVTA
jgi:hypothetical protein